MSFPNTITTAAQWSSDGASENVGAIGPFQDGASVRYIILQDLTGLKLRAYRSADKGVTWAEVDAANAPAIPDDAGSPAPGVYQYYSVARDATAAVRKLYVVYFHTDFTIRLITFDMAGQVWGAQIGSALTYRFDGLPFIHTAFGVAHRPTDNVVWMMFAAGIDGVTPVSNRVYGAKCDLTGAAWGALVALGTTDNTDPGDWQVGGMVRDSANNMHLFFPVFDNATVVTVPPFTSRLFHQVIHTNDSLTVPDLIVSTTSNTTRFSFSRVTYPSISAGNELLFTYSTPNAITGFIEVHAVRAVAGDSPAWSNELPPGMIQTFPNFLHNGFKGTITLSGLDYIFYSRPTGDGVNSSFIFITSSSVPGSLWSGETLIGVAPFATLGAPVQPANFDSLASWAITMVLLSGGFQQGQAYWELGGAAPVNPKRCLQ